MGDFPCPICGDSNCRVEFPPGGYYFINCKTIERKFFLGDEIFDMPDTEMKEKILNLVTEWILRKPFTTVAKEDKIWHFYYEPHDPNNSGSPEALNMASELENYPSNVIERVNRALVNLSLRYLKPTQTIEYDMLLTRLCFCEPAKSQIELANFFIFLRELEYVIPVPHYDMRWKIRYKGWEKIDELTKRLTEVNQGFIAMSYSEEAKPILETFRSAIKDSGYDARIIGEKEHNHQIVPEMFYEIERSKFMVVDVTLQNFGAYYEAGYAQALGKEVIVCCSKEVFDDPKRKPHFDIAQKPIIIWTDLDDLKERLIRRIQATVH